MTTITKPKRKPDLVILSLGAGVQSTVMALMGAEGVFGRVPDCAIFADTQWEPKGVYKHLDWLESVLPYPVYRVTAGDIRQDHLDGINATGQAFSTMPLFTERGGMGRRQCTMDYKIRPILKKTRELLGLGPRQRVPKGVWIEQWIGISTDEASRAKPPREDWRKNRWPLIEIGLSRRDCARWFESHFPNRLLVKSACIGCPFHNDALWRDMKINDPISFSDAVAFDASIRRTGVGSPSDNQYIHRSCAPLGDVDFRNLEDMGQLNFFENECEGMCGV